MINERMLALGKEPSAIRKLYAYGLQRAAEIGAENVYDLSIGNPSIPAPEEVQQRMHELADMSPLDVHGYTMAAGQYRVREVVANNLKRRFGIPATADQVYMTTGATAALAISIAAITNPGDNVIVPSPFFPEYRTLIESVGCTLIPVPMTVPDFQLDIEAIGAAITEATSAVIVNSPNNPVGCVYAEENIKALAALLEEKQKEFGHPIYIISDEPYREITYGIEVPFTANYYTNTIVCYSWAKSLSLPGERIGYIYVSDNIENAADVFAAVAGAGRALGYICATSTYQYVIETCIDCPTNVEAYAQNRKLLTEGLDELGYQYVAPDGAFYLWVKALEDDAQAFSDKAKEHDLLVVASDSFGMTGWVRCSYCVAPETIKGSMKAWAALKADYEA